MEEGGGPVVGTMDFGFMWSPSTCRKVVDEISEVKGYTMTQQNKMHSCALILAKLCYIGIESCILFCIRLTCSYIYLRQCPRLT